MVRILGVLSVVVLACACRTTATRPEPQGSGPGRGRSPGDGPAGVSTPPAGPSSPGETCADVGRPWDGRPTGCTYEHAGCCYDDAEAACAAAKCPRAQCQVLESYPAQVACDPAESAR